MIQSSPERFILLDGIRGVAALFIVHRHAEQFFGRDPASSYLAVDLFFALSGFVLAHAYSRKLREGAITSGFFMKARFARLYPLYVLALALMAVYFICLYTLGLPTPIDDLHRLVDPGELVFALVTGLLFLPAPFTLTLNGALFLVSPAWSLFNELVVNAFYARWGVKATTRQIAAVLAVSAIVLVVAAAEFGRLHAGFRWHEMYAGMGRVFFSFFAGVLIYRFRNRVPALKPVQAALCLLLVCLILAVPISRELRPFFDLAVVLLVWPLLLFVASKTVPGRGVAMVSVFLGTASYAVYVLHIPLLAWTELLIPAVHRENLALPAGIVFLIGTTCLSWWLTVYYDQPVQKWLKNRLRKRNDIRQPV
ncbi:MULTISPECIES: acyltransferase [unclassified Agrobacterium]|uniref:acyltransferase family protein n=1 Tax=unclassified Agrobacterium TaxID=2632611 RepID=UPI002449AC7D|nr:MULTISPECIES: acyltransferase [unclassified Agrobacterium]MDH0616032.1 acyltransferase [Agrobacterium sp. GD03872]MDH1061232.1 acyltransferase [Agrobacterium sp. GD03992]MDH2212748.1 acyltransferase [Agrobacterium sp. GD03643]MDH2221401.1 acyltransferase [Agrobacterium sp. GD03638]MDH2226712.1 acyltransferase [Agrobacterium sp. GD03642]